MTLFFFTQVIEDTLQQQKWQAVSLQLRDARRKLAKVLLEQATTKLVEAQSKRATIQTEKAHGAWIRSRAKWDFEADKSTKMYFNLERKYQSRKNIQQIRTEEDTITKDPTKITQVFRKYYQDLYVDREIEEDTLHKMLEKVTLKSNKLNNASNKHLFSRAEIRKAIKSTKRGSSPGPDGLPIEFYKTFKRTWAMVLEKIYKEIARTGRIPSCMEESFITLIAKKKQGSFIPRKLVAYFTAKLGL